MWRTQAAGTLELSRQGLAPVITYGNVDPAQGASWARWSRGNFLLGRAWDGDTTLDRRQSAQGLTGVSPTSGQAGVSPTSGQAQGGQPTLETIPELIEFGKGQSKGS